MKRKRNASGQFVKAKKNPTRRRKATATVPASVQANPKRRRRRSVSASRKRTTRRYRRNPSIRSGLGGIGAMLTPALTGAAGAVVVDAVLNYAPLPATLKVGMPRHLVRAASAVLLGVVGGKLVKGRMAADAAKGALTVALHGALADAVSRALPGTLGAYVDMMQGTDALGYYGAGLVANPEPAELMAPAETADMGAYSEMTYSY